MPLSRIAAALVGGVMLATPVMADQAAGRDTEPAGRTADEQTEGPMMPMVLTVMMAWINEHFDLPLAEELPRIVMVPPDAMAAARYNALLNGQRRLGLAAGRPQPVADRGSEVTAFYDEAVRTIHLPLGWRGDTPRELSVLVHELVHHMQAMAGLTYPCAQARERPAFAAQERWLVRFGGSLEADFGMDAMTVFVRTRCM